MALDKAAEEELILLAARVLLQLAGTATGIAGAVVQVVEVAYKFIDKAAEGDWGGAVAVIYNFFLGPFAIAVAYPLMRGQLKDVARAMERESRAPFEQTSWVQRQAWVFDTARQERVCIGGPYNPETGRAGSCSLQPAPGWVRRMVTIGTRGPLAGRAVVGVRWEKLRIFGGIRAEILTANFVEWRP